MNLNVNYYATLNVLNNASNKDIKKSYYKLSFQLHPDLNPDKDHDKFQLIAEAYEILSNDESKLDYDKRSKFGKDYNEMEELFKVDMQFNYSKEKEKLDKFKEREILDIIIKVNPETFDGTLEYPRYVLCKTCKGSGKDLKSKIIIKDEFGNVKGMFDADDGCDMCEGTGTYRGVKCNFCHGEGKVGMKNCETCNGDRRTLGKQKLSGVKLTGDETKVDAMGHLSPHSSGGVGNLVIKIK